MVRYEGVSSLFRGLTPPVLANLPVNAIVFGCYGTTNRALSKYFPDSLISVEPSPAHWKQCLASAQEKYGSMNEEEFRRRSCTIGETNTLNLSRLFFAGTIAGVVQCLVTIPAETMKIKLQSSQGAINGVAPQYTGFLDCVRKSYKAEGLRGIYRGIGVSIWRDAPAYGVYFASYEWARKLFATESWSVIDRSTHHHNPFVQSTPNDTLIWKLDYTQSTLSLLGAGSVAGVLSWTSTYPLDVLKSVIQALPHTTPNAERHMMVVARRCYEKHGMSFFFRGFGTTIARSIPVNAVTFYVYEVLRGMMGEFD